MINNHKNQNNNHHHHNHNHCGKVDNRNNVFAQTYNNNECYSCNTCENSPNNNGFIPVNAQNPSRVYQHSLSIPQCSQQQQHTQVNYPQGRQLKQNMPQQINPSNNSSAGQSFHPPSRLQAIPYGEDNHGFKNYQNYQEEQRSINQSFQDKNNSIQNLARSISPHTRIPFDNNRFLHNQQEAIMEQDQDQEQDCQEEQQQQENCENELENNCDGNNNGDESNSGNNYNHNSSNQIQDQQIQPSSEFDRLHKLTEANRNQKQQIESKQQPGDIIQEQIKQYDPRKIEEQFLKQQRQLEQQKQLIEQQQQQIQSQQLQCQQLQQQQQQILMQQQQQQQQQQVQQPQQINNQSNNTNIINSNSQNQVFIAAAGSSSSGGQQPSSGGILQQPPIPAVPTCASQLGGRNITMKRFQSENDSNSRSRSRTPKRQNSQPDISALSKSKMNSKSMNLGHLVKNNNQDINNAYNTSSSSLSSSNPSVNLNNNVNNNEISLGSGCNLNINAQQSQQQQVYVFQQGTDGNSNRIHSQGQQQLIGNSNKAQSNDNRQQLQERQQQPINQVSSFNANSPAPPAGYSNPHQSQSYTLNNYNTGINLVTQVNNKDGVNNNFNYNIKPSLVTTNRGITDQKNSIEQFNESMSCEGDVYKTQQQQTGIVNKLNPGMGQDRQQKQQLSQQSGVQAQSVSFPKTAQQLPIQAGSLPQIKQSSSSSQQKAKVSFDPQLIRNPINNQFDTSHQKQTTNSIIKNPQISSQQQPKLSQQGTSNIPRSNQNTIQHNYTGLQADNLNPSHEGLHKEQIFHDHLLTELWDNSMNPQLDKDNPFAIFPIVTAQDSNATGGNNSLKNLHSADNEDKLVNQNQLQQNLDDEDPKNGNPNGNALNDGEDEGKSQRGLRSLSLKVKEIVLERGSTTYKDVANALVAHLKTNNTNPNNVASATSPIKLTAAQSKEEIKDEQNIKRRVYDALNVLIASEVIVKKGKKVCASQNTSLAGRCLNTDRWMVAKMKMENVEKQLEKVNKKRSLILDLVRKFLALSALLQRNRQYEQLQRYYDSKRHLLEEHKEQLASLNIQLPPLGMSHNIINDPYRIIHTKNYFVQNIRIPQNTGNANNNRININTNERNQNDNLKLVQNLGNNKAILNESSNDKHTIKDNSKKNSNNKNNKQSTRQSRCSEQILSSNDLPIKYHFPIISLILNRGGPADKSKKVLMKLSSNNTTLQVMSKQPMKTLADLDILCAIGFHKVAEKYKSAKLADAFIKWQMEFEEKVAKNQVLKSSVR